MTTSTMDQFLRLVDGVGEKTLKVDLIGTSNFTNPDMTVILTNPVGLNADLDTLIDQRVFMV